MATSKSVKAAAPAKKVAAKKAPAKKTTANKTPAAKKAVSVKAPKIPKAPKAAKAKPARKVGKSFVPKETYSAMIQGLMDQGLERDDAIETLKVGLRQANGLPVPAELLRADNQTTSSEEA